MVYGQLRARGVRDERVLAAMSKVPREEFAEAESLAQAYGDYPLPIGAGQTVSQPYIVASMVEALAVEPSDRVLEIGTGTGYEAAILGEIAAEVWTIERVPELARKAQETLARLGYDNVHVVERDGSGLAGTCAVSEDTCGRRGARRSRKSDCPTGRGRIVGDSHRQSRRAADSSHSQDQWRGGNYPAGVVSLCAVGWPGRMETVKAEAMSKIGLERARLQKANPFVTQVTPPRD